MSKADSVESMPLFGGGGGGGGWWHAPHATPPPPRKFYCPDLESGGFWYLVFNHSILKHLNCNLELSDYASPKLGASIKDPDVKQIAGK